jgi:hypothetical protein
MLFLSNILVGKPVTRDSMILSLFKIFLFAVKTLNIRRRHWILKQSNQYINRNWRMVAEGIRMAQYLFYIFFIKELY